MLYKNTRTGAILDSPCSISGGNWEPIKKNPKETNKEKPTAKKAPPKQGE